MVTSATANLLGSLTDTVGHRYDCPNTATARGVPGAGVSLLTTGASTQRYRRRVRHAPARQLTVSDPTGMMSDVPAPTGLDPDQVVAVRAPRSPLCILAGAGT